MDLLDQIKKRAGQIDPRQEALGLLQRAKVAPVNFLKGFISEPQGRIGQEFQQNLPVEEKLGQLATTAGEAMPYTAGAIGTMKVAPRFMKNISNIGKFADWDQAVDIYRQGLGSIDDITRARATIIREAQQQMTSKEFVKLKGNFNKMIDFVQKR